MKKIILLLSIFFINISFIYAKEKVDFYKCVDGDTFRVKINGEEHYVRMIAIDTPESVKEGVEVEYYGKESSEYTCNKLSNAKKIELEYDDNSDKYDKYDRLIAWVFVDGNLLQEDLVKNGYAKIAYLYGDYKYVDILKENQEIALAKEIGIWDQEAKDNYKNIDNNEDNSDEEDENILIIISGIVILIITFIGSLFNKNRKK